MAKMALTSLQNAANTPCLWQFLHVVQGCGAISDISDHPTCVRSEFGAKEEIYGGISRGHPPQKGQFPHTPRFRQIQLTPVAPNSSGGCAMLCRVVALFQTPPTTPRALRMNLEQKKRDIRWNIQGAPPQGPHRAGRKKVS